MICYHCGCNLTEHDFCTNCGVDVSSYKLVISASNIFYNEGLEKAKVRDLSGAVVSLRQCLKLNKNHVDARNLLGLVYFEMGESVAALCEWIISKNLRSGGPMPSVRIADTKNPSQTYLTTSRCDMSVVNTPFTPHTVNIMPMATTIDTK